MMAGGRSERMRASGVPIHKALLPVLGMSLAERNLRTLLAHGFVHIAVSVNARESALMEFLDGDGRRAGLYVMLHSASCAQ